MLTKHQHLLGYNTPRCPAALGHGGVCAVGLVRVCPVCLPPKVCDNTEILSFWFMRKSFAIPGVLPRKEDTYKYTKTQQDLVLCKRKHDCDISPENEESFFFDAKLLSLRNNTSMQFCADRTWVLK